MHADLVGGESFLISRRRDGHRDDILLALRPLLVDLWPLAMLLLSALPQIGLLYDLLDYIFHQVVLARLMLAEKPVAAAAAFPAPALCLLSYQTGDALHQDRRIRLIFLLTGALVAVGDLVLDLKRSTLDERSRILD